MKVKTSELTGDNLGYAVALIEYPEWKEQGYLESVHDLYFDDGEHYAPWQNWAQAGPIIEREKISLEHLYGAGDGGADVWVATRMEGPSFSEEQGPTALVAAMRCYVAACLGDDIEIPEELE